VSRALDLSTRTLDLIVAPLGATERLSHDGGAALVAGDPTASTGVMRIFEAPPDSAVDQVVQTVLAVPARGVTTCMIFAFTRPGSAIPHFTLDCSDHGNGGHAFHLDLTPRAELATHIAYMDAAFTPLTAAYDEASAIPGLSPTRTTRRQFAMMSPWMLVHLADAAAFDTAGQIVGQYARHWLGLVEQGLPDEVLASLADADLPARDAAFRQALFSPDIDPVWGRVTGMIGAEAAHIMRSTLVGEF
jgi:hypothetical protein